MAQEQQTVADIFRRAQTLRRERPSRSYKELKADLLKELKGSAFPSANRLAIPEQDDRAPEEDWTAGLPLVLRGIQQEKWEDIVDGIVLSLEQVENYERERGPQANDSWHDRSVGIAASTNKAVSKWMPEELMALAEKQTKKA